MEFLTDNKVMSKKIKEYEYAKNDNYQLLHGDCIEIMSKFQHESIDLIFADPPYFLSNHGITCQSGKWFQLIRLIGI